MVGRGRSTKKAIRDEAKRLLRDLGRPAHVVPWVHSDVVRCSTCDQLVNLLDCEVIYDENGDFTGWECEIHI
jgi:hypothetical protein